MDDLRGFIRRLPKADLHVHFEGLIGKSEYRRLTQGSCDATDAASIFRETYGSLNCFIDACREVTRVVRTEADCFFLVREFLRKSHEDGVVHVELAVEPDVHERRGLRREALLSGIRRALAWGRRELGISSGLILSLVRDEPTHLAEASLDILLRDPADFVAVGLASRELGNPPSKFKNIFARAKAAGFRVVVHAGEEGPPDYIWSAIRDLGADRIDHGLRAAEDKDLLEYLQKRYMPVALAPISNFKTGCLQKPENLTELLKSRVCCSISTDDPGLCEAGMIDNHLYALRLCNLSRSDLVRLAQNSVRSSFAGAERKRQLLDQEVGETLFAIS